MLLPIRIAEIIAEMRKALALKLAHDDLTHYNAVQRVLYVGIIVVIILQVLSGLVIWKPVQFSELAFLFYDFQGARLVHFLGMAAIVGFVLVHVALALIVPKTLVAMLTGGPDVPRDAPAERRAASRASPANSHPEEAERHVAAPTIAVALPAQARHRPERARGEPRSWSRAIDRRKVLRGGLSLGALTMLTGCDVTSRDSVQRVLKTVSQWNDRAQALLFRPNHLAPTYLARHRS